MTEQEWSGSTVPELMLVYLRSKVSKRKLRLFAIACCHRILGYLDDNHREANEVAECYVDGKVTEDELITAAWKAADRPLCYVYDELLEPMHNDIYDNAARIARYATNMRELDTQVLKEGGGNDLLGTERKTQTAFLRDIVGNPFNPVTLNPSWQTATVVSLAQAIYDDRRFRDMPILADALEDAGCTNDEILKHCRSGLEHVRGCWVVDLVLAKE